MLKTGNGRAAPKIAQLRDTPQDILFEIILDLQSESFRLRDLAYALDAVIGVLSEADGVSRHPGVSSAETLVKELTKTLKSHHQMLEDLEAGRFQASREVA